jgi:hypothetical protein
MFPVTQSIMVPAFQLLTPRTEGAFNSEPITATQSEGVSTCFGKERCYATKRFLKATLIYFTAEKHLP